MAPRKPHTTQRARGETVRHRTLSKERRPHHTFPYGSMQQTLETAERACILNPDSIGTEITVLPRLSFFEVLWPLSFSLCLTNTKNPLQVKTKNLLSTLLPFILLILALCFSNPKSSGFSKSSFSVLPYHCYFTTSQYHLTDQGTRALPTAGLQQDSSPEERRWTETTARLMTH